MTSVNVPPGMIMLPSGLLVPESVPTGWNQINQISTMQIGVVTAGTLIASIKAQKVKIGGVTITLPSSASLTPLSTAIIKVDVQNDGTASFKLGLMFFISHMGGTVIFTNPNSANCSGLIHGDGNATNNLSNNLFYYPSRTIAPGAANAILDVESGTFTIDSVLGGYSVTTCIYSIP